MRLEQQADLRLLPLAGALWGSEALILAQPEWVAGLNVGLLPGWTADPAVWAASGMAVAGATGAALRARRRRIQGPDRGVAGGNSSLRLVCGLCVLGVLLGTALAAVHISALRADPIPDLVQARAVVAAELRVASEPVVSEVAGNFGGVARRWSVRATVTGLEEAGRRWHLDLPVVLTGVESGNERAMALHPGVRVRLRAAALPARVGQPEAMRLAARSPPQVIAAAPWWQRGALAVRKSLRSAVGRLAPEASGLLPGLAVGDDSELPTDTAAAMRSVGMSHLTAVSGSNLAIVTGLVVWMLRRFGAGRKWAVAVALVAMAGFVVVVGPQPSVQRAAVMATIALLCLAVGRTRTGTSALLATVVILLMIDPWLARSWGFALSVAATGGLLGWSLRASWGASVADNSPRRPESHGRRLDWRGGVRSVLAVALVCQLATAPLVAALGGGIPLVGVVANAAVAPAVPLATALGLAAGLVGLLSSTASEWVAIPGGYAAGWIAAVARLAASVPGGVVPWPSGLSGGASLLLLLICAAVLRWRLASGPGNWIRQGGRLRRRTRMALATALALIIVATTLTRGGTLLSGWPPDHWLVVFCDVGQGDAAVLRSGPGHAVVVDVGPDPRAVGRCLRDLRVDVIDFLLLTHFHADHVEGLSGAVAGRRLGRVMVSPLRDPPQEAQRVDRWIEAEQRTLGAAPAGESGQIGDVSYQVIWPSRIMHEGSMPNNASVALVARIQGVTVFLPGDMEPPAQHALMSSMSSPHALVTKIPHHGSRNQDPGLVAWTESRVAVASVGAHNMYGHPSERTLGDWRKAGATVLRTDLDGDVVVWRTDAGTVDVRGRSQRR